MDEFNEQDFLLLYLNGFICSDFRDYYFQFCYFVGLWVFNYLDNESYKFYLQFLYVCVFKNCRDLVCMYMFIAMFVNILLFIQIVFGVVLIGLVVSDSSRVLIIIFGVFNIIIVGVIVFLKLRG